MFLNVLSPYTPLSTPNCLRTSPPPPRPAGSARCVQTLYLTILIPIPIPIPAGQRPPTQQLHKRLSIELHSPLSVVLPRARRCMYVRRGRLAGEDVDADVDGDRRICGGWRLVWLLVSRGKDCIVCV